MTDTGFDLTGRRALVTGASAGIGAAIALRLAHAGAEVVAVSRSGRSPDGEDHPRVRPLVADLTDPTELDDVIDAAVRALGGLDILVNNAGRGDWRPLAQLDRAYFDGLMGLNLWAPLRLCQLAHPYLAASDDGAVVMIGSVDAVRPSAGARSTAPARPAWRRRRSLSEGVARRRHPRYQGGPGIVATPLASEVVAELEASGFGVNIVRRAGTGDEIAGLVHYLVARSAGSPRHLVPARRRCRGDGTVRP